MFLGPEKHYKVITHYNSFVISNVAGLHCNLSLVMPLTGYSFYSKVHFSLLEPFVMFSLILVFLYN